MIGLLVVSMTMLMTVLDSIVVAERKEIEKRLIIVRVTRGRAGE
jgi:hypothetical protein